MYRYVGGPVDFFDGCIDLWGFLEKSVGVEIIPERCSQWKNEIVTKLAVEMAKMRQFRLEGDVRGCVSIFTIPDFNDYECKIGFIWKQNNNGTTFVSSPVELPSLAKFADETGQDPI